MKSQRGGFFLGMIVGLLIGLALALAVALYVTKVPLPFIDKVPQRTAEQDAAEAEHNKNWDPNSPLYGANPAKPKPVPRPIVEDVSTAPAAAPDDSASASPGWQAPGSAPSRSTADSDPASARNPANILAGGEPAVSTDPAAQPFSYYVQAGAYGSSTEAEQQRAKLSMMGLEPRIAEREVNGRTMFRVRIGPFAQRDQAEEARVKLAGGGIDSALVRVQK